jgi:urease accessory protein
LLLPTLAHAHPGHTGGESLLAGMVHPLLGVDHLLALLATGLLAFRMGGRMGVGIAVAFPTLMAAGAVAGLAGVALVNTEVMILVSIAVLAWLALKPPRRLPATTLALTALFAVFHGHAHGLEAAGFHAGTPFVAGMTLASALAIAVTMWGAGLVGRRLATPR